MPKSSAVSFKKSIAMLSQGSIITTFFEISANVSGSFSLKETRWEHGEKP
jgi:hypothetical protein